MGRNPSDHRKNFFNGDQKNHVATHWDNTVWNGIDANGNAVADGVYDYVIHYTPMVPGAEEQSTTFKVRVDTQNQ